MAQTDHLSFTQPADKDVGVWRYMSLAKFVWMLQKGALYFPRCDMMGDPFEGHYSRRDALGEEAFVLAQRSNPAFSFMTEDKLRDSFRTLISNIPIQKRSYFVNCWHMNEYESLAMWKLYAAQHDSICIRSFYSVLAHLLPHDAYVGVVRYIDYNDGEIDYTNGFNYVMHKRKSFEHEREVRAVVWEPAASTKFEKIDDRGLVVPVPMNELIQRIYISPNADSILVDVVTGLKQAYKLDCEIVKSSVNDPPDY
jgi:hypothetical protein